MDLLDLESNDNLNPRLRDTFNDGEGGWLYHMWIIASFDFEGWVLKYIGRVTDSPGLESIMEAEKGYSTRVKSCINYECNAVTVSPMVL
jgi:hypothetical protein